MSTSSSRHIGIAIDRPADEVYAFMAEPLNFPKWAHGLGHSFAHVLATDPQHEHGGIGKILIHHSFASARTRGSTVFDLLAPADPYKREHADGSVAVSDRLRPLSLKGRLACHLGIQHWRPLLKTLVKRLPAGVSRQVVPTPRQGP